MIDTSKLTPSDTGRHVVYTANHGEKEFGVISSWNEKYVFVKYGPGSTAAATNPEQLDFAFP